MDFVLCTDWSIAYPDDKWVYEDNSNNKKFLLQLSKYKSLYYGYICKALDYCIEDIFPAQLVLVDTYMNILSFKHITNIDNKMYYVREYKKGE